MIRSILVALDGSPSSNAAVAVALRLAARTKARVEGLGVIDADWIHRPEAVPIGALSYKRMLDLKLMENAQQRIEAVIADFAAQAAEAGVDHETSIARGDVRAAIDHAASRNDLIVLGKTSLHSARGELSSVSISVEHELRTCIRPILVVPDLEVVANPGREMTDILIAFDGSPVSSRTLHMFALLGIGRGRKLHVLTQDDASQANAAATAAHAARFLKLHGQQTHDIGLGDLQAGTPAESILGTARTLDCGMIVMGAYGHRGVKEMFGSVTKSVIAGMTTPLFVYH